jgi:hypothetical protein
VSAHDADLLSAELEPERISSSAPPQAGEHTPAMDFAAGVGNRGFGQFLSRMHDGEGILPSGVAHPAVESTIAAMRGSGRPLDSSLASQFGSVLGRSVSDIRVHTDATAASLTRAVSARAFATGRDLFFAAGEYQPATHSGRELIAHEVAHADQQLGAPMSGPLVVSNPGEPLEVAADETAGELLG